MEVTTEMGFSKRHKTAGPNELSLSFGDGNEVLTAKSTRFLRPAWTKDEISDDWLDLMISWTSRNDIRSSCGYRRGIRFLSIASNLFAVIILRRLSNTFLIIKPVSASV